MTRKSGASMTLYGHEGLSSTGFTGFSDFSDIFRSFSDIFGDVFGFGGGFGGGGGPRPQAGNDLRYDLTLDFLDAALGTEVTVEVPRVVTCRTCSGSGAKPGTKRTPCPQCGGRGASGISSTRVSPMNSRTWAP